MKTTVLAVIAFFAFSINSLNAQSSCPVINNGSFRIVTNAGNPCLRYATFTFRNPTSGAKRINVRVIVGSTELINDCVDASGQVDVTRTYTSANFTACNIGDIRVQVTPYTGSNCGASACAATIMSIGGAPLPVKFSSFNASRTGLSVTLNWETATEINNEGFAIERNTGNGWEQVGFVATRALNGSSNDKLAYQYTELNNSKSMSQYRLKQLDMSGSFEYSDIRTIRGTAQEIKTTVYPNPAVDGKVNVVFGTTAVRDIMITDMAGRTLKQYSGYNANSLTVSGLPTGMFTLMVYNRESGERSTEKIMVTGK